MLDFTVLQQQLNDMVGNQTRVRRTFQDKLALARQELASWSERWSELGQKADDSRTSWLLAGDLRGPLSAHVPAPERPGALTVAATDGSQIFPDRHEFADCYVLNVGKIVLHYGSGERPLMTSAPRLFYRENEMTWDFNGKRIPVTSEIVGFRRGAWEIRELALLAEQAAQEQRKVLALTDGTLILWALVGKPPQLQQQILETYRSSFDLMYEYQVPFIGYISQPGSAEIINILRVGLCPENPTNCDKCPYKHEPELPCEPIEGVTDADLFSTQLQPGERTALFKSRSDILQHYGPHTVYFFYVHVGTEIARIEIPHWVANDAALLDFVHAASYDQAQKGQGYPVSLAESHELAVVRSTEREQFFRTLEHLYVRQGLEVSISRKSLKKRNVNI